MEHEHHTLVGLTHERISQGPLDVEAKLWVREGILDELLEQRALRVLVVGGAQRLGHQGLGVVLRREDVAFEVQDTVGQVQQVLVLVKLVAGDRDARFGGKHGDCCVKLAHVLKLHGSAVLLVGSLDCGLVAHGLGRQKVLLCLGDNSFRAGDGGTLDVVLLVPAPDNPVPAIPELVPGIEPELVAVLLPHSSPATYVS